MKRVKLIAVLLILSFLVLLGNSDLISQKEGPPPVEQSGFREITGTIKKGETFFTLFRKYNLDIDILYRICQASVNIHRLQELDPGRSYKFVLDNNAQIDSFSYAINDDCVLNINRRDGGYSAEKVVIDYEKRILHIRGMIKDNLIASMGEGSENLLLALQLSDLFAWDIDFTTDLQNDDSFNIVVEGLYQEGKFKRYGSILAAEFVNNSEVHQAYAFTQDGKVDYYDENGKSLRKYFLKTPLSFRRISSVFSQRRNHPILKITRPHNGIDYAAATGTPVSATGEGRVLFAGRRGQYGNLVIIGHRNAYKTYYGHLAKIDKNVKVGARVDQGKVIGSVGSTGLATGPHLHYETRLNDRPINPASIRSASGKVMSKKMLAAFQQFKNQMDSKLAYDEALSHLAKN